MNDEKLREEFPGNAYTNVKPSGKDIIDTQTEPKEHQLTKPDSKKPKVVEKKKTVGERLVESITSINPKDIIEKLIYDWLFPGIEAAGEDILHSIFNPDRPNPSTRARNRERNKNNYIDYNSIYDRGRDGRIASSVSAPSRKPELIFTVRAEAYQVLAGVNETIDDYGRITLKDFYTIVSNVTEGDINVPTDYTLTKYGWRSVETATIRNTRDGYLLSMPKAELFDR